MEPTDKRFRIALSFAGEKRDFVAQVAAVLAERFGEPTSSSPCSAPTTT